MKNSSLTLTFTVILMFVAGISTAGAEIIYVPGDEPTIQAGIDAATDGDTVVVADGTYTGEGNRDLVFGGKAITVISESNDPSLCIIDCQGSSSEPHRGFNFYNGEGPDSVVSGFTITNGYADAGGGMKNNYNSSPTVTNCTFSDNSAGTGGGMYNYVESSPTLTNCTFSGNTATDGGGIYDIGGWSTITNCTFSGNTATDGGGIYGSGGYSTITNCIFSGNSASKGGGMYKSWASYTVTNCTFFGNTASNSGGGIYDDYSSSLSFIFNCILWGDTPDEIYNNGTFPFSIVNYCDIEGGNSGGGNINQAPMFVDPGAGDFRLQQFSPCIGVGNNDALPSDKSDLDNDGNWTEPIPYDFEGDDRILDGHNIGTATVDMGADEYVGVPPQVEVWVDDDWAGSSPGDPVGGHTFEVDAFATIQPAIYAVSASGTVNVADGTYTGLGNRNVDFMGKAITVVSENGHNNCIIDCESEEGTRGFIFQRGEGPDSVIDGFTITNGNSEYGGGIKCTSPSPTIPSSPTITNCIFSNNSSSQYGGGMYNWESSPEVTNCTFSGNSARSGGGMYNGYNSSPTVTDCTFTGNSANWANLTSGGGMSNTSYTYLPTAVGETSPTLTNCTFSGNTADYGGGMSNQAASSASRLRTAIANPTLTDCTFSGNTGGGMSNSAQNTYGIGQLAEASPTLTNCTFTGNTGRGMSNKVQAQYYNVIASPTLTNCTFSGNTGGGMGNLATWSSDIWNAEIEPTLTNCTFTGNSADDGGGMWNYSSAPTVINCTFTGNSAGDGGGMWNYSSAPTVTNCILWGDGPDEIYNDSSSTPVVTYSNVELTSGMYPGVGNINADPLFVNQSSWDFHLQASSPCIDAANGDVALETDMDGNLRVDDPTTTDTGTGDPEFADMGAYEFVPGGPCVEPPSGLVGWWPGDGDANDIWGENHGTLVNGATFASGTVGQAFSLDGVDDYVQIPYDASFNLSSFTLQAWVKFTQDTYARIISRPSGGNPTDGYSFFYLSSYGDIGGGVQGEGQKYSFSISTIITFNDDTWHLCTFVRDVDAGEKGEIRIYVDAYKKRCSPDSSPGDMEHNPNGIIIGSYNGSQEFFGGLIDEVAIWNRALTTAEILAIYNEGRMCYPPNTPTGSDVMVLPLDARTLTRPVTVVFDDVCEPGTTSLTTSGEGEPPPSGFQLGYPATYYELTTTATFSGSIQVCIDYSGISLASPSDVNLYHFEDTDGDDVPDDWVNCTVSVDTVNKIICGTVTSFSLFAIFEPENQPPVADAGDDQTVEQESYDGTEVTLDGSGSTDPDSTPGTNDDIVSFDWYEADTLLGSGETINYTFPLGTHTVTLVVTDNLGETDDDEVVIVVQDTTPPEITCPADVTVEQESHAGTVVPLEATATDDCDPNPVITSNELVIYPLGVTIVTFTATDASGNSASCSMTVTVVDTTPPEITCPADVTVEQESYDGTVVPLQATATDNCDPNPVITSDELPIYPLGVTVVTFTATDASGNSASCSMTVTVVDTTAPTINSISASPDVLWPVNHKMVEVAVTVDAEDICDPAPVCNIVNVTSNEPINGLGDGDKAPDWEITGNLTVKFRAERAGGGTGRVYTINIACTDASGNTTTATVEVTVPHDKD